MVKVNLFVHKKGCKTKLKSNLYYEETIFHQFVITFHEYFYFIKPMYNDTIVWSHDITRYMTILFVLCVLVSVCVDQCHQEMGPFPCGNVLRIFHDHNIQRLVESIIRTRWYFSFGFFLYQDSKASSPVTDPLVRMSFKPIYNKIGLGLAGGTVLWFSIISIIILTIIIIFKAITR